MSMVATIAGLSPLVFNPGTGTKLYRRLDAMVLLGLLFSTLVTPIVMPASASFRIATIWDSVNRDFLI